MLAACSMYLLFLTNLWVVQDVSAALMLCCSLFAWAASDSVTVVQSKMLWTQHRYWPVFNILVGIQCKREEVIFSATGSSRAVLPQWTLFPEVTETGSALSVLVLFCLSIPFLTFEKPDLFFFILHQLLFQGHPEKNSYRRFFWLLCSAVCLVFLICWLGQSLESIFYRSYSSTHLNSTLMLYRTVKGQF